MLLKAWRGALQSWDADVTRGYMTLRLLLLLLRELEEADDYKRLLLLGKRTNARMTLAGTGNRLEGASPFFCHLLPSRLPLVFPIGGA